MTDLNSAVNMFGHFLKYKVSDAVVSHDREPSRSAFEVIISAQLSFCGTLMVGTCENMSADILHSHSTSLLVCLQSQYWKRPKFIEFKPSVEKLAGYMAQYCEYLCSQNKKKKKKKKKNEAIA